MLIEAAQRHWGISILYLSRSSPFASISRTHMGLRPGPPDQVSPVGLRYFAGRSLLLHQRQQAVVKAYPGSPSARAITDIARVAARWQPPQGARGNVEFFVERLIQRGVAA